MDRPTGLGFPFVPRVDVALEVIADVVADVHLVEVPEFGQFTGGEQGMV